MARQGRRARAALRLEALESRCLLSGDVGNGLLIGFNPGTNAGTIAATVRRFHGQVLQEFTDGPVWIEPGAGVNVGRVESWLKHDPSVRYVEPNGVVHADAVLPDDPGFPDQWGLNNTGTDVDIDAPEAWQVTQGNPGTIVAVIDSGLDFTRPDFSGRLWVNPAEAQGFPGADDDGDGEVDDLFGWNFRDGNNDLSDGAGHGTHVTGILAADADDGNGIAGVDWNARIMPLKFIGPDGSGSVADAVQAIYYAVDHGARVINASWGGTDYSQPLVDAIQYADNHGVVFVTAAGNESVNNDRVPSYPALNRLGNLISVAAVDAFGRLASFSNYGPTTVDIAAPGVGINSDVPGGFASYSGTSMATPFVAGVASLVVGQHPDWNAEQVVQRVVATAKPLPALTGLVISGGIIDAANAVAAIATPTSTNPPASTPTTPTSTPTSSTPTMTTPAPTTVSPPFAANEPGDQIRAEILASAEFYRAHGNNDVAYLDALYRELLDRPIDPAAQTYWLGRLAGEGRLSVADAIIGSPEAIRTKVARWMKSDLGWGATIANLKTIPVVIQWADRLIAAGQGDSAIHQIILASTEFYDQHGGNDASWLDALYQEALGRSLDPGARSYWLGQLAQSGDRSAVAFSILTSAEARRFQVAHWFHDDLLRSTPVASLKSDPAVIGFADRITD